jgi:hypothetical protein
VKGLKITITTAGLRNEIWTRDLPITNQSAATMDSQLLIGAFSSLNSFTPETTVKTSVTEYSTLQYNTIQYNTICSTAHRPA